MMHSPCNMNMHNVQPSSLLLQFLRCPLHPTPCTLLQKGWYRDPLPQQDPRQTSPHGLQSLCTCSSMGPTTDFPSSLWWSWSWSANLSSLWSISNRLLYWRSYILFPSIIIADCWCKMKIHFIAVIVEHIGIGAVMVSFLICPYAEQRAE